MRRERVFLLKKNPHQEAQNEEENDQGLPKKMKNPLGEGFFSIKILFRASTLTVFIVLSNQQILCWSKKNPILNRNSNISFDQYFRVTRLQHYIQT